MSVLHGSNSHDSIAGTAEADILVGGAGSDTYVVDHAGDLVVEAADPDGTEGSAWWGATVEEPVTLIRLGVAEYVIRVQVDGAPDGVFAEFQLREVSPGVLGVNGLRVADVGDDIPDVVLAEGDSVWEYAFQLGRASPDGGTEPVEFYGGGHGSQVSQGLGLKLDGVDFTALPIGTPVNGRALTIAQDLDIILPTDGTTVAGSVLLQHVFDGAGLTVRHAHDYLDGFVLGGAYSAMLPLTGADHGGIDYMQVGSGPVQEVHYGGTYYYPGSTATEATGWGDDHNYLVRMTLPSGGPDVHGDWSLAGDSGMWFYDTDHDYSKVYVNWSAGGRHAAINSAHETHYAVTLRDPGLPAAAAGTFAPRPVSQGVDTILASVSLTLPDNIEILRLTGNADLSGSGNRLNNSIIGNDGNNRLDGGGGEDLLYGGLGDDTYLVKSLQDHVIEKAGEGIDTVLSMLSSYTLGANVENVTYLGQAAFTGVGSKDANRIEGSIGNDTLRGLGGDDALIGGAGDDTLVGGDGADHLVGGAGRNVLLGEAGDDVIDMRGGASTGQGGVGDDVYYVDDRAFTPYEAAGEGVDEIRTGLAVWTLGANFEVLTYTGAGAFLGIGGAADNRMTGGGDGDQLNGEGGADVLIGLAGSDLLMGGDGDDVLIGGAGADRLNGGAGVDTADYSAAAAGVQAQLNAGGSSRDGDGGTDTFTAIENLTGSAFNDTLIGDAGANVLRGGLGADTLVGLGGDDVLWGGAGQANTLQGGAGDDRYVLDANDSVYELAGEGTDTVEARINTYVLAANVENLMFTGSGGFAGTGNALANVIIGGAGDDILRGGGGVDQLKGGAGRDTADYTLAASGVTARLDTMRATNDGDGFTDVFSSIENLIGSNFNDLLIGDAGNNVLMGGVGRDTVLGMAGDDVIWGGPAGGDNQLQGGLGDDYYVLEAFDTVVEMAGEGIDTVEARLSSYLMRDHIENLVFNGTTSFRGTGNSLDNRITGGAKDDIFRGGGGDDSIFGGAGRDELQLRGAIDQYRVLQDGAGWRVIDSVAGRDGSTYVEDIEVLRFLTGGAVQTLGTPAGAAKSAAAPQILPMASAPEVGHAIAAHLAHVGGWAETPISLHGVPQFDDWVF